MANFNDWADSLQSGDLVAVWRGSGWSRVPEIRSVQRTTTTQVVVDGCKYRKYNGRSVGDRSYSNHIAPVTDDIRNEITERDRRSAAMRVVGDIRWHSESVAVLEAVADAYKKAREIEQPEAVIAVDPVAAK